MIIFDLDGTLADCEHRRHFVDASKNSDYEYSNFGKDPITHEPTCDHNPRWHRKDNWDIKFKPEWKAFYEACDKDEVIIPVMFTFCRYWIGGKPEHVEIWSGRCESVKEKTLQWLLNNWFLGLFEHEINVLRKIIKMRPIGDYTPDDQLKERWLDEALAEGKNIEMVFDDRPKVVRMWRRRGIFVFDCNQTGVEF